MKIIISVLLAVFLLIVGCSDDSTASSAKKEEILKKVNATAENEPVVVEESVEAVIKEDTKTAVAVAEETTVEVVQEVTKKVEKIAETTAVKVVATKSGADLFKVCSSCHGVNAEKKALNKSQIIQGWDAAKIASALNGYKDGSYGGAMKGLMKAQVIKLSDEDINVVSKYISEL